MSDITHIEDWVITKGMEGFKFAIEQLEGTYNVISGLPSKTKITTKWDGSPAVCAGIHPDTKKFFVGTKAVFNKQPKINYTEKDIKKNHPNSVYLQKTLSCALKYFPELGINTVLQGDILYINDDFVRWNGYLTFKPNTITYAIPENTDLANRVTNSKIGIVFHTERPLLKDVKFNPDISNLKVSPNVWWRDASCVSVTSFDWKSSECIYRLLDSLKFLYKDISKSFVNKISTNKKYSKTFLSYMNNEARKRKTLMGISLLDFIEQEFQKNIQNLKKYDAIKNKINERDEMIEFFQSNWEDTCKYFSVLRTIIDVKNLLINKLSEGKHMEMFIDGQPTQPEGYVCISKEGVPSKLVDRMNFSYYNFNNKKDWE